MLQRNKKNTTIHLHSSLLLVFVLFIYTNYLYLSPLQSFLAAWGNEETGNERNITNQELLQSFLAKLKSK